MSKFTQFIGIDISKEYFDASILVSNFPVKHDQFPNTKRGVTQFLKWVKAEGCSIDSTLICVSSLSLSMKVIKGLF